jgi:hypothetical protein
MDDHQKVICTENDSRLTNILDLPIVQNMKMQVIKSFIEQLFGKKDNDRLDLTLMST